MKANIWWQHCAVSSGLIVLFCCPLRWSRLTHYSGHCSSRYYDEVHEGWLDIAATEKTLDGHRYLKVLQTLGLPFLRTKCTQRIFCRKSSGLFVINLCHMLYFAKAIFWLWWLKVKAKKITIILFVLHLSFSKTLRRPSVFERHKSWAPSEVNADSLVLTD